MEIVYLSETQADYLWMYNYYTLIFPEGKRRAEAHFDAAERLLSENPHIGRQISDDGVRELAISRTPFSFIYRIKLEQIEVLRIWDGRADRASLDLQ
jgi:plasmid stabilization system protein ParE